MKSKRTARGAVAGFRPAGRTQAVVGGGEEAGEHAAEALQIGFLAVLPQQIDEAPLVGVGRVRVVGEQQQRRLHALAMAEGVALAQFAHQLPLGQLAAVVAQVKPRAGGGCRRKRSRARRRTTPARRRRAA